MGRLADDLAAFAPQPKRRIRLNGQDYALRAFLDLSIDEALEVVRGENESMSAADRARANLRQVEILVPDLPKGVCRRLTPRQTRSVLDAASEGAPGKAGHSELQLGLWFSQAARFYGWPWSEIRRLTIRQLQRFLTFIPVLQAHEHLDESMICAFPHLDLPARRRLYRAWRDQAAMLSPEEIAQKAEAERAAAWGRVGRFLKSRGHD